MHNPRIATKCGSSSIKTGQGPCTFNGASCPANAVIGVAVERVPLAQAQAAQEQYIAVDASPAQVDAFSAPLAQRITERHVAAYRQAQAQVQSIRPFTVCPSGTVTDYVILTVNNGTIHWNMSFYTSPSGGTGCNERAVNLALSPNTGNAWMDRVSGATAWTTNPSGAFDASTTSDNGCDYINNNPVLNNWSGVSVSSTNGPETVSYIKNSNCSNVVFYATVSW